MKQVLGRKTDHKDAQWIARLLRWGLLKPSLIPPRPIRDLRDLCRYRKKLTEQVSAEENRIQKMLEDLDQGIYINIGMKVKNPLFLQKKEVTYLDERISYPGRNT
jgi:transposase